MDFVEIQTDALIGKTQAQTQRMQDLHEFHTAAAEDRVEAFRAGGEAFAERVESLFGVLKWHGSLVNPIRGARDLPAGANTRGRFHDRILLRELLFKGIGHQRCLKYSRRLSVKSASMLRRLLVVLPLLALLCATPAGAQLTPLTLDQVFGVDPPWGLQPPRVTWAPDGNSFLYVEATQDPFQAIPVYLFDVRARSGRTLIDPRAYGKGAGTPGSLVWSPDSHSLTFTIGGTLYVRNIATGQDQAIDQRASDPQWSPHGDAIAYVKAADLYVASLAPKVSIRRLTRGGSKDRILNGGLDWVYPEELSTSYGFAWSPEGTSIAYMRMDEHPVTNFPLVDFMPVDNIVANEKYPLAGESNPKVTLRLIALARGKDVSLLQSFIDAGETNVDFMVYPRRTHSIAGIAQRRHLYGHMLQWWLKHL